MNDILKI